MAPLDSTTGTVTAPSALPLLTDPLTAEEWQRVADASAFIAKNLPHKEGSSVLQRFRFFAHVDKKHRDTLAVLGLKHIKRAGVIERGYEGETIYDHCKIMMYMAARILKIATIAETVYRKGRCPIKERALVFWLGRNHDSPETLFFDMSKTEAAILPAGMKRDTELLGIKVIFQYNADDRRRMEKYEDKSSTIDRFVKITDAMESVIDAIAENMSSEHFEEFYATAITIVDEFATPQMKLAFANKLMAAAKEYYYHGDHSHHSHLTGQARNKAVFDVIFENTFNDHTPRTPKRVFANA